jgi:hypothetical protein
MRACCAQGRVADLDTAMSASLARFMSNDQSDLDPQIVAAAQEMLDHHKTPNVAGNRLDPVPRGKSG